MAIGDTPITVVGNLVASPELRFTPSGAAVADFRIASTPKVFNRQSNQWEDGEPLFLKVNVWRKQAENVAESLEKGMQAIVVGKLQQRQYETREGEKRSSYEILADYVGPALTFAYANVVRNPREQSTQYSNSREANAAQSGGFGNQDQGGFSGNQPQAAPDNDPWNSAPPAGSGGFSAPDDSEPPF
ncbi:single-stranded DNA-binding protein [Corynebacterium glutamicum]|uniref:single-stranded DNA-binding protein n=1 Tax=Corynebacterium glutamicum TaxID=1718 RepID=UPI00058A46E9|nr:single-stranded DNA-binding protein [Corynebacterium glutamicum]KIH73014.1 single-stranded DNA-binding protein [Corynebacterium glutamicum]